MKEEKKVVLIKYGICFGVEILIAFLVIWSQGFFTDQVSVNLQILSDAFIVSGALMSLLAGMLFISQEGGLIGLGFILRNVFLAFVPFGRLKHERYIDYRTRKLSQAKKHDDRCILFTGLFFLIIGIILSAIWYYKFYNV